MKKVNIEILKNKKTAFVGESGSGKSTIVALIERFYDPIDGTIFLDGLDIKELNLQSLRKKIGYVGQEPVLFSGTIRENLLYALVQAKAYDFVQNLDKKLDTFIGIGGNQLSGGQKQRIAIARAILKNPPILLLDEATSALDRTNEAAIQNTLDDISGGRTTIVVAHRLTTIQDADRIYVMSNGMVDDYGTHAELLNRHGKYEALVKIQLTQNQEEEKKKHKEIQEDMKLKRASFHIIEKQEFEEIEMKQSKLKIKTENELKLEVEILKKTGKLSAKTKHVFRRLFKDFILPHYYMSFPAYLASMIAGGLQPLMAILMGNIMESLFLISYPSFRAKARDDIDFYAGMFCVLGAGALVTNALNSFLFTLLGEKISFELKSKTYYMTLKRKMAYFDDPENNPDILSSRISIETQNINILIGSFMGVLFNGIGAFICGIILSLVFSWQIALC